MLSILIDVLVGIGFLMIVIGLPLVLFQMFLDWCFGTSYPNDNTHHDNKPYSHFRISSQELRDKRKESYGL